jgi:hypothetical protein
MPFQFSGCASPRLGAGFIAEPRHQRLPNGLQGFDERLEERPQVFLPLILAMTVRTAEIMMAQQMLALLANILSAGKTTPARGNFWMIFAGPGCHDHDALFLSKLNYGHFRGILEKSQEEKSRLILGGITVK